LGFLLVLDIRFVLAPNLKTIIERNPFMENLSIDHIALKLTTALIKGYGKELIGTPDVAIHNAVSDYFKMYDEVKKQMKEHTTPPFQV